MGIQKIKNYIQDWFSFPQEKVYCQVATIGEGRPQIRTMGFYDLTQEGHLVLMTETSTRKWLALKNCPDIAVCVVHPDHGQIVFEGSVLLKTQKASQLYWDQYLEANWKAFYAALSHSKSIENPPDSFGAIIVMPKTIDLLLIDPTDFLNSKRTLFELKNNHWQSKELLVS